MCISIFPASFPDGLSPFAAVLYAAAAVCVVVTVIRLFKNDGFRN